MQQHFRVDTNPYLCPTKGGLDKWAMSICTVGSPPIQFSSRNKKLEHVMTWWLLCWKRPNKQNLNNVFQLSCMDTCNDLLNIITRKEGIVGFLLLWNLAVKGKIVRLITISNRITNHQANNFEFSNSRKERCPFYWESWMKVLTSTTSLLISWPSPPNTFVTKLSIIY